MKILIAVFIITLFLAAIIPIESRTFGACDNIPFTKRLSLLMGDDIDEEYKKLGGENACPSTTLELHII